jgi:hypothetical protein
VKRGSDVERIAETLWNPALHMKREDLLAYVRAAERMRTWVSAESDATGPAARAYDRAKARLLGERT